MVEYKVLLIDEDSPAIKGCLIQGLNYTDDNGKIWKAIIQKKVEDQWEDLILTDFDYRYMVGNMESSTLQPIINGKPCVEVKYG